MSLCRYSGGKPVKTGDYDALHEIAAICALCNDSSVDYNEVSFGLISYTRLWWTWNWCLEILFHANMNAYNELTNILV